MSDQAAHGIEVGATNGDGTLRHWLAVQAVAKGEAILGAQLSSVGRLATSATSILGWSVTIALALTAALPSTLAPPPAPAGTASLQALIPGNLLWPALAVLVAFLSAAVCCVVVLWPGYWRPPGVAPVTLLNATYDTELEVLEALAMGYEDAFNTNAKALTNLEKWLRAAWALLASAPFVGVLVYVLQRVC